MAKEREITTKFKVDISDLKAGIAEANRHIKLANSEFKAATAGMDSWSKSSEGLQAKIKQLNSVLDAEKSKLSIMEEQYRKIAKESGESSKEAEEFKIKLNNQQAAVNKAEAELRKYTQKLDDLEKSADHAGDDLSKLGNDAKQASTKVGSLENATKGAKKDVGALGDEAKDTAKDLDDIEDSAKGAEKAVKKMGDGFTVAKGALATFAGNIMTSLAGSVKTGISNLMGLSEATREYREDMGKLETAFASANVSTETATATYKDFYAVLGEEDRSVEAVNHLARFVDTEKDMADWTDICTGVWGTFGDSLPIEGLTEAANETMKTGELTGVLTDALNWGAKSGETFGVAMKEATKENEEWNKAVESAASAEDFFKLALQECSTEQERQALITDTLTGLYGDAAEEYRKNNKNIMDARQATSDYNDTLAKLGEKMEPVTTAMTRGFTKILEKVLELVEGVDMDAFVDKISDGFTYVADTVLPALISGIQAFIPVLINGIKWIIDNSGLLMNVISGITILVAGLKIASLIANIISIIGKIKEATTVLTGLKLAFTMLTGPVGLVISAIALIVVAFASLWKNCEGFREFWTGLWEGIKNVVGSAVDWITGFFGKIIDFVKNNWQGLLLLIANPFVGAFKLLYDNCEGFREFWNGFFEKIKEIASSAWEAIKGFFSAAWDVIKSVWSVVVDFFKGIWEGIKSVFSPIVNWFKDIFSAAWEGIKSIWNTVAPFFKTLAEAVRIIFDTLGKMIGKIFELAWAVVKGVWNLAVGYFKDVWEGIKKVLSPVADWFKNMFSKAWEAIKSIWNAATKYFGKIWDGIKSAFSKTASWFKDTFSKAWDGVTSVWNKCSDFFKGIWNKIKDIFADVGGWFGDKFGSAWETIKSKFAGWGDFWSGLWTKIKDKFGDIGANIGDSISSSITSGLNNVLGFIEWTINKGIRLINGAINLANLLPGVNVGLLDEISLPRLAKGGVLRKGQVGLLEGDGSEAVVPLDQNKKWIRKTAKDMAKELGTQGGGGYGGNGKNVVNNYNFTQNNTSPKALNRLEIYRQTRNQFNYATGGV